MRGLPLGPPCRWLLVHLSNMMKSDEEMRKLYVYIASLFRMSSQPPQKRAKKERAAVEESDPDDPDDDSDEDDDVSDDD